LERKPSISPGEFEEPPHCIQFNVHGECLGPKRVEKILEICSHVEQFAFVPAGPFLGKVEDCELSCSLHSSLLPTLNAFVVAPSIHVLCLLYALGIRAAGRDHRQEQDWAEKARLMTQNLATQVLRHLADQGPNVRLLAISLSLGGSRTEVISMGTTIHILVQTQDRRSRRQKKSSMRFHSAPFRRKTPTLQS
jgi:hypothetical protein